MISWNQVATYIKTGSCEKLGNPTIGPSFVNRVFDGGIFFHVKILGGGVS